MTPIERLVDYWRRTGVELQPPASSADSEVLQRALGISLPPDVVQFYTLANGMVDGHSDDHWVSFWSIKKILHDACFENDRQKPLPYLDMADVFIDLFHFTFQVRDGVLTISIGGNWLMNNWDTAPRFPSLSALADRYLEDPGSLGVF